MLTRAPTEFVTVHHKCSKNLTVDFIEIGNPCGDDGVLFVLRWASRVMLAAASKIRTSNSSRVSICLWLSSFYFQVQIEKSNGLRSGDWNSFISVTIDSWTHADMNFFTSRLLLLSRTKILNFRAHWGLGVIAVTLAVPVSWGTRRFLWALWVGGCYMVGNAAGFFFPETDPRVALRVVG